MLAPVSQQFVSTAAYFIRSISDRVARLGEYGLFFVQSLRGILSKPLRTKKIIYEIFSVGYESLTIIVLTGFFTGMVLGLQGYHTLKRFGAEGMLGAGVAYSLLAELAPVLSALLLTGRAGSSLCAEIGVMRIREQIEALECLAIDVFNYLVSPKLTAGLISLPLLIFIFTVSGIIGGYVAGSHILGVYAGDYYAGMLTVIDWPTIRMALVKGLVFASLVITICSWYGYTVHNRRDRGAVAVSRATTVSVVASSVCILLFDYLLTAVLL